MEISRMGMHFKYRNIFWNDLFCIFRPFIWKRKDMIEYLEIRGPRLFFKYLWFAIVEWYKGEPLRGR